MTARPRRRFVPRWLVRRSIARRMGLSFLAAFATILFLGIVSLKPVLLGQDDGLTNSYTSDVAILLALPAVTADRGRPSFTPPPDLLDLAANAPRSWLVVDVAGQRFTLGDVPPAAVASLARLPARLRSAEFFLPGIPAPLNEMSVSTHDTPAGEARLAAGGVDPGAISWRRWLSYLLQSQILWTVPLMAVFGIAAVAVVVPFVLRPLRRLADRAAELGPDNLDQRLPEHGVAHEVMPLVRALNAAFDRVGEAFERQRGFIADVAHELRTPIAVLALQVDALPPGPARQRLERSVWRLGELVGQMLDSQRLTLGNARREPVDLVALAREVVADVAPLAIDQGYEVALHNAEDKVEAVVDRQAIARALSNLLGNAVAHGGGQGRIDVRVTEGPAIEVADGGPGVPVEARERIFAPFRRERWDRDGCGLGLYLAREILRAHGGDAVLVPSLRGATFRLALPRQHPAGASS